ncbi:hypothetical protein VTN00DRAFT_1687 [Thermoascus crustaceus]|uniref:uncharacterized protein n=1 Tax=Thermoascus crustaceus TaxID=5088 RepID=UPI0037441257
MYIPLGLVALEKYNVDSPQTPQRFSRANVKEQRKEIQRVRVIDIPIFRPCTHKGERCQGRPPNNLLRRLSQGERIKNKNKRTIEKPWQKDEVNIEPSLPEVHDWSRIDKHYNKSTTRTPGTPQWTVCKTVEKEPDADNDENPKRNKNCA